MRRFLALVALSFPCVTKGGRIMGRLGGRRIAARMPKGS
jgi:hypothetical protein